MKTEKERIEEQKEAYREGREQAVADWNEKLDALGRELTETQEPGNEARRKAVESRILLALYEHYIPCHTDARDTIDWSKNKNFTVDESSDAILRFLEGDLPKYDAEKGNGQFSVFVNTRMSNRLKDSRRVMNKCDSGVLSIDDEDYNNADKAALQTAQYDPFAFSDIEKSEILLCLVSDIVTFEDRLGCREHYYRLFYTDDFSACIADAKELHFFLDHEKQILAGFVFPFLDFYSRGIYRSVQEIAGGCLKPCREVMESDSAAPVTQPLPQDVYRTYLQRVEDRTVSRSAVSQQKKAYQAFLQTLR